MIWVDQGFQYSFTDRFQRRKLQNNCLIWLKNSSPTWIHLSFGRECFISSKCHSNRMGIERREKCNWIEWRREGISGMSEAWIDTESSSTSINCNQLSNGERINNNDHSSLNGLKFEERKNGTESETWKTWLRTESGFLWIQATAPFDIFLYSSWVLFLCAFLIIALIYYNFNYIQMKGVELCLSVEYKSSNYFHAKLIPFFLFLDPNLWIKFRSLLFPVSVSELFSLSSRPLFYSQLEEAFHPNLVIFRSLNSWHELLKPN